MNYTAKATQLRHVRGSGSASWRDAAFQGRWTGQNPRLGAMYFPTLLDVDWNQQRIQSVSLRLYFAGAGGAFDKTLHLYRGAKAGGISGNGDSMRGAHLGNVAFSTAYIGTRTALLNESTNADAFADFVAWLKSMSTDTLVMYVDEGLWSSHDYSYNYCKVTSAAIVIEYEPAGSDGRLDKDSVDAGSAVALTITPPEDLDGAITHSVQWQFGGHSQTQQLAEGVLNTNFTVPMAWLNAIPANASGGATCTLTTYLDGEERGQKVISFTIFAPASAGPAFTGSITPAGQVTAGYYQYLSAAKVTISGAQAQYGASIRSYRIAAPFELGGADSAEYTTPAFARSGAHTFTLSVTDSRGLTANKALTVDVLQTARPAISQFKVERYSTIEGDTTQYVQTDYGDRVWVSVAAGIDGADGHNSGAAYIEYGPVGGAKAQAQLSFTGNAIQKTKDRAIITAVISPDKAYEFTLYVSDKAGGTQRYDSVPRGTCVLHADASGHGLGVGRFVNGTTEEAPLFACAWPAKLEGGAEVAGALAVSGGLSVGGELTAQGGVRGYMTYTQAESDTGMRWYDGKAVYVRVFSGTQLADGGETVVGTIAGVGEVVRFDGYIQRADSDTMMPLTYSYYNNAQQMCSVNVRSDGAVRVQKGTAWTCKKYVIAVLYTKA